MIYDQDTTWNLWTLSLSFTLRPPLHLLIPPQHRVSLSFEAAAWSPDEMCSFVRVRQQCMARGFDKLDTSKQTTATLQGWLRRRGVSEWVREWVSERKRVIVTSYTSRRRLSRLLPLRDFVCHAHRRSVDRSPRLSPTSLAPQLSRSVFYQKVRYPYAWACKRKYALVIWGIFQEF